MFKNHEMIKNPNIDLLTASSLKDELNFNPYQIELA
jgi:hypothetical protein